MKTTMTPAEAREILRRAEERKDPWGWTETERERMFFAGYLSAAAGAEDLAKASGAEGDWRDLGWGTMVYACSGTTARPPLPEEVIQEGIRQRHIKEADAPALREGIRAKEACGWEHRVWLGLGCEGPEQLKRDLATVPVPFICGRCPGCETGSLQHARWNEDEEFEPRPIPPGAPRFLIPAEEEWSKLAIRGYGGADYVDPTGRTR